MIPEELLKESRLELETFFHSLNSDTPENQSKVEEIRAHSQRVGTNALVIAKVMLQNEEEIRVAQLIGFFHDIGKAAMIAIGSESSATIQREHAAMSVKLIQQMTFFSKVLPETQILIVKSIENHNKLKLPKLDNEQQVLYSRLLRDADKLDIFESSYKYFKERFGPQPIMTFDLINQIDISDKIIKSIMAGKTASVEDMKTMNDYKLLLLSMAFDLNFKPTFRIMSEKQYIQKIYETLPKRDHIIDAYRCIKLFVENKFVS